MIVVLDRLTQVLVTCVENWDTREGTVQRASQSHQERGTMIACFNSSLFFVSYDFNNY